MRNRALNQRIAVVEWIKAALGMRLWLDLGASGSTGTSDAITNGVLRR